MTRKSGIYHPAPFTLKAITRALVAALMLMSIVLAATAWLALRHPTDTILPGVYVQNVDVSGMTVEEAVTALTGVLPAPESAGVDVRVAGRTWRVTWADVGQHYDIRATVQAAYAVGRDAAGDAPLTAGLRRQNVIVAPLLTPADPARVRDVVGQIAAEVARAPLDADLTWAGGNIVATDGQAGQQLDVEAAATRVLQALAEGTPTVELPLTPLPPRVTTPEPARTQAQALLAHPFTLIVDDPLTGPLLENELPAGYHAEFSAPPERVATWLEGRAENQGIRLYLNAVPVQAWLEEIAPQLGDERLLDIGPTLHNILAALYDGQHQAQAHVRHPERVYSVQPGDTLSLIAFNHHMPLYQLKRANPDVDPGAIDVGQKIIIPSIDVLLPHPLVPGKRIEIDLPKQQMRVFEYDTQIYTFTISSGISRTPTIPGQFQILFKEEMAFAPRWRLDMPYFMGIYEEDDGFFNGIHELPITHYGTRLSRSVLGWPASFGCIILDVGDAETLFRWAEVGTLVRIEGYAPGTPSWQQTLADLAPLTPEEDGQ
ncbi:MAG TPA: peptidoglycan binding domain-containing protein [Anaerolineae bacterium]|nr:peptidoglycan binding domain-containing protein [Anaerolineae bacterium]HQK14095.1 peptidoglycan binding domain-containing protein [Anaerolineae bacterium]